MNYSVRTVAPFVFLVLGAIIGLFTPWLVLGAVVFDVGFLWLAWRICARYDGPFAIMIGVLITAVVISGAGILVIYLAGVLEWMSLPFAPFNGLYGI